MVRLGSIYVNVSSKFLPLRLIICGGLCCERTTSNCVVVGLELLGDGGVIVDHIALENALQ